MKFEDLLMRSSNEEKERLDLEEEVAKLRGVLDMEEEMKRVLRLALHSPQDAYSCRSSLIPLQIRLLLAEVAMMEEEIIRLERKLQVIKSCLYHERREKERCRFDQLYDLRERGTRGKALRDYEPTPVFQSVDISRQRLTRERDSFVASASEMRSWHSTKSNGNNRYRN